jgi:hypothetical protein
VYKNHAFIVVESTDHDMQVFDLTQLRDVRKVGSWDPAISTTRSVSTTGDRTGSTRAGRSASIRRAAPRLRPRGLVHRGPALLFLDDEIDDGANGVAKTRTIVFDMNDLEDPVVLTAFYGNADRNGLFLVRLLSR